MRGERFDECNHLLAGGRILILEFLVHIDPVEIDAVKPGVENAAEIAVLTAENDRLPILVPVADQKIGAISLVRFSEPGRCQRARLPVRLPVIAVLLRFPDREIGEHDAPAAVGPDLELADLGRCQSARVAAVAGIVDHEHVVGCGSERIRIDLLQLVAPALRRGERACWNRVRSRRLRDGRAAEDTAAPARRAPPRGIGWRTCWSRTRCRRTLSGSYEGALQHASDEHVSSRAVL